MVTFHQRDDVSKQPKRGRGGKKDEGSRGKRVAEKEAKVSLKQRQEEELAAKDITSISLGDLTIVGWGLALLVSVVAFGAIYYSPNLVTVTATVPVTGFVFVALKRVLEYAGVQVLKK